MQAACEAAAGYEPAPLTRPLIQACYTTCYTPCDTLSSVRRAPYLTLLAIGD
jgi:hypothetical protein